ncbi:MAG: MaoC/PaaZ C-terminal domain-containing protein [Syntrophales bacterium]|nr:MaoC/PaaZ C-terminal domain-containing protein [Syntrophales bacterium]
MEKEFFEDYKVGEVLVSPGRTITETDIVLFSAFTGDWHELHTNVEYAAKTPFGERIAHGMLGLTVGMALLFRLGPYVAVPKSFIAFYGMDTVRFTAPIKIGDTIHCEMTISALTEKDSKRGIIEAQNAIKNQKGETVIFFNTKILVGRKPAG